VTKDYLHYLSLIGAEDAKTLVKKARRYNASIVVSDYEVVLAQR
jgi:hypothetical protein